MPWQLDKARGWWLLLRDGLVILAALVLILHDAVVDPPADPVAIGVAGAMIAGVFANRQDEKDKNDGS